MGKWIAGVLSAVIIFWLTQGVLQYLREQRERDSAPGPAVQSAEPIAFLVVGENTPYRDLSDIGAGTRICGGSVTIEALRAEPSLNEFSLLVLNSSELQQAWMTGVCPVVMFRDREHVSAVFPANLVGGRVIAVYR
jgi:hypothetical protein